jgi:predicted DNA-binding protein YlxM (UPF0122 family)
MTDKDLADKYNISRTVIWKRRHKFGIKAYKTPIDWKKAEHLFNELSIMEIAKKFHISTESTYAARRKLGLSEPRNDRSVIDQYLDTLSDAEIAEKFDIKKSTVYHRRIYLLKRRKKGQK